MPDDPRPADRFTADEMSFLRFVEFGHLPPRVKPEDLVTGTESEPRRQVAERPEPDVPAG